MNKKSLWKLILILAIPCIIGFMPAPAGLSELAWVLVNCRRRIDGRGG